MKVKLDYENSRILVDDVDGAIQSKRRCISNLRSIGGQLIDSKFVFDTDNKNKETILEQVQKVLNKFGISVSETAEFSHEFERLNEENKSFNEFSERARNIRNNKHNIKEFQEFTDAVYHNITNRTLYELQLLSAYHLAFSQNACNFSVPGTGKTSTVYGAYSYLKSLPEDDRKHVDKILIICPLAAFEPWVTEYEECFGVTPNFKKLVNFSSAERQLAFYESDNVELFLISYQSATLSEGDKKSIELFLKNYKVMLVLDEAHRIKNTKGGAIAEGVLSLARYASSRVVLTGTPAPNGYQDLVNLFKFIWPTKKLISFPLHYLEEMSKDQSPSIRQNVQKLIDDISPFFIRVTKATLGLPEPVVHQPVLVPMTPVQEDLYLKIESKLLSNDSIVDELKKAKLIRLMQCASNPKLLSNALEEESIEDYHLESIDSFKESLENLEKEIPNKFPVVKELIENIISKSGPDGKVIIWMTFVDSMHRFKDYLKQSGIEAKLLYGGTPTDNGDVSADELETRSQIIKDFHNENSLFKVIIANPFAVGESISLHKACRNAIYMEKNFNAAQYIQSKDRIHRYGLDENDVVNYFHVHSQCSIDEDIYGRLLLKESQMLSVIESEEIPLLRLDDEASSDEGDFKAVLKSYYERRNS